MRNIFHILLRLLPPWSCSTNFPLSLSLSVLTHPQKNHCLPSPVLTGVAHIVLVAHDMLARVGGVQPAPFAGGSLIGAAIVSEPHTLGRPVNPRRLTLVLKMGTFSPFLLFSQKLHLRGRRVFFLGNLLSNATTTSTHFPSPRQSQCQVKNLM